MTTHTHTQYVDIYKYMQIYYNVQMCNICKAITYKYILMFIQTFKKYIYIFFTVGLFESCSKPMCKDLESVIQSEVSQKEKNKYRILRHICGI